MRKSMKKWTTLALVALSAGCLGAGVSQMQTAVADETEVVESFVMEKGASVRLNADSTGIRFTAETNVVDENATYNFVIAPTYYFEAVQNANGATDWVAAFDAHSQIDYYIHLKDITPKNADDDAAIEIRGSVEKLKFNNMNLAYTGIAYKEVAGVRTYASFSSLDEISRSVTNVSSAALNSDEEYETEDVATMSDFIKKGCVLADGYQETVTDDGATYQKGEGEALTLEAAYNAVSPTLSFGETETYKLLHEIDAEATLSVDNVDLAIEYETDGDVVYKDGKLQALTTNGGTLTAKAGLFTATLEVEVDGVETRTATTDTVVDTVTKTFTAGEGLELLGTVKMYDVTGASFDLQYASGKVTTSAVGERTYAVLTESDTYYVNVVASDCVIKTYADFCYYMGASSSYQTVNGVTATIVNTSANAAYAILGADIEGPYKASSNDAKSRTQRPNGSVFDGRGYTVAGVYMATGWFGSGFTQENVTLKNVTIDNYIVYETGLLGSVIKNGTIENVKVTVLPDNNFMTKGGVALVSWAEEYTTFKNVDVTFCVPEGTETNALNVFKGQGGNIPNSVTFDNVNIYTNGSLADFSALASSSLKDGGTYTLTAGKDFKSTDKEYAVLADSKTLASSDLGDIGDVEAICLNRRFLRPTSGATFESSILGEVSHLKTTKGMYKVVLADYVIEDVETLNNFFRASDPYKGARSSSMYAVVSPKDGTDTITGNWTKTNFKGTHPLEGAVLNGLGNTLAQTYFENGMFDSESAVKNYTMKNITFDRVHIYENRALGHSTNGLTLENCHITFEIGVAAKLTTVTTKAYNLFGRYCFNFKMINSSIYFDMGDHKDQPVRLVMTSADEAPEHSLSLVNSQIVSNGLMIKIGEADTRIEGSPVVKGTVTMDATSYIKDKEDE